MTFSSEVDYDIRMLFFEKLVDGRFIGYNTYTTSEGPDAYGESLDGFLRQKKYFAPVLIGIRDKR